MEFINRDNEVFITRYYPSQNPRTKYKRGDVIHNYDYLNNDCKYSDNKIAHIIQYDYKKFYFVIVGYVEMKRKIIDSFDIFYCTRDEAIDRFLDYCREKNYKIYFEIK